MTSLRLGSLEKMAKSLKLDTDDEKFASLSRALELFSLETDRLEGAYNSLKEEFTSIYQELEATNKKLIRKVSELDVMTFYFESIVSNIGQGIVFIDLNGDVRTYNAAAEKIFETKKKAVLNCSFWQNFDDALFGFSLRETLASRFTPAMTQTQFINKDGEKRELEINASFIQEEGKSDESYSSEVTLKKLEGVIVLIRDTTEILLLQSLANRNDRMKELGEMAAMLAHEIRNPLGGIKGFASLLKRDLKEMKMAKLEEMAGFIVSGTETLNQLVTNVLNYSRPISPQVKTTDLVALVKELKMHYDGDPKHLSVKSELVLDCKCSKLQALADPSLLKLAILNLLANSFDAMDHKGNVSLTLSKNKNFAIIEVIDNGCGIPAANLEKIFTPFFTTKPDGNGFGLSEVHKVIEAHNGHIEVNSEVGKGTTFRIEIPLDKNTGFEKRTKSRSKKSSVGESKLIS